jgi:hypothetical protein
MCDGTSDGEWQMAKGLALLQFGVLYRIQNDKRREYGTLMFSPDRDLNRLNGRFAPLVHWQVSASSNAAI